MLGGLNVASIPLGAVVADESMAGLFDDVINTDGVSLATDDGPVVKLAGEGEVPVVGVILSVPQGGSPGERLADFAIELSRDGVAFSRVLTARLSAATGEQSFALPQAMPATSVRLVPLSAQGGAQVDRRRLAEFAVIAAPDFVLQPLGFDIALPALGGHVIRAAGFGQQILTGESTEWPGDRPVVMPADRSVPPEWVLGFLDGRAARIASLTWHERLDTAPDQRIQR